MFQKQMSEDRIGSQGLARKEAQGLPDANRRGNRMRPQWALRKWRQRQKNDGKTMGL
jgi:hypothetical protein